MQSRPHPPSAQARQAGHGPASCVCAPVRGRAVALRDVGDPAFSQGMLGEGLAFQPSSDVVCAPVTGIVAADTSTNHALVIRSQEGLEVLVHVGLDTAGLRGRGFVPLVSRGEAVERGQELLRFDRELVVRSGLDPVVVMTLTELGQASSVRALCEPGREVSCGEPVLEVLR